MISFLSSELSAVSGLRWSHSFGMTFFGIATVLIGKRVGRSRDTDSSQGLSDLRPGVVLKHTSI